MSCSVVTRWLPTTPILRAAPTENGTLSRWAAISIVGAAGKSHRFPLCFLTSASGLISLFSGEVPMTVQLQARQTASHPGKHRMSGIFEVEHPLIQNHLARLRD